jgi:hypothetical protein
MHNIHFENSIERELLCIPAATSVYTMLFLCAKVSYREQEIILRALVDCLASCNIGIHCFIYSTDQYKLHTSGGVAVC